TPYSSFFRHTCGCATRYRLVSLCSLNDFDVTVAINRTEGTTGKFCNYRFLYPGVVKRDNLCSPNIPAIRLTVYWY
ncbi:MAG: hypothetical protein NUV74_11515, partial [Candidatus Brocadiaceae bacterium]|nr:hypothetical protein [Candidatus Brocadiaceae bacterium]